MMLKSYKVCNCRLCVGFRERWTEREGEGRRQSEVSARDRLDGILEIYEADDECLK